ncbi:hypothetical protein ACFPRL_08045 [Pseudoclavibacter helvolus]
MARAGDAPPATPACRTAVSARAPTAVLATMGTMIFARERRAAVGRAARVEPVRCNVVIDLPGLELGTHRE